MFKREKKNLAEQSDSKPFKIKKFTGSKPGKSPSKKPGKGAGFSGRPTGKPAHKQANGPANQTGHQAGKPTGAKPARQHAAGGQPQGQSQGRPTGKPAYNPTGKPSGKPQGKPAGKPAFNPAAKSGKPAPHTSRPNQAAPRFNANQGEPKGRPHHQQAEGQKPAPRTHLKHPLAPNQKTAAPSAGQSLPAQTDTPGKPGKPQKVAGLGLGVTRMIEVTRPVAFAMWTQPEHLNQWWGSKAGGSSAHTVDLQPGGLWTFIVHHEAGIDTPGKLIYREAVKPQRLALRSEDQTQDGPGPYTMKVKFAGQGGATRVSIKISFDDNNHPNEALRKRQALSALHQSLDRLEAYAEAYEPEEDVDDEEIDDDQDI